MRDDEHPPAQQLVRRVVTLLSHDEVVYFDGTRQVSGEWTRWTNVVLTADRVIYAT